MSKMLTGGAGLNAEYVTVPVAVEATLSAGLAEQANTSVDPATVVVSVGHVVDSLAVTAVWLNVWENRTTAGTANARLRPIGPALAGFAGAAPAGRDARPFSGRGEGLGQHGMHCHRLAPPDRRVHLDHDAAREQDARAPGIPRRPDHVGARRE